MREVPAREASPLDGVTVVAVEQAVAAPPATRHLADLGARVIMVERPDGGDFARRYDTAVGGGSSYFVWANRTKESVVLDLSDPGGRAALDGLVARMPTSWCRTSHPRQHAGLTGRAASPESGDAAVPVTSRG